MERTAAGKRTRSLHSAVDIGRRLLRLQHRRQLPRGRVVEDERARKSDARTHRGLQLIAQLHRAEGVDARLHQRRIRIDHTSCRV